MDDGDVENADEKAGPEHRPGCSKERGFFLRLVILHANGAAWEPFGVADGATDIPSIYYAGMGETKVSTGQSSENRVTYQSNKVVASRETVISGDRNS
jgi:hypothetical protein